MARNLPNTLTLLRIAVIPAILALLFVEGDSRTARWWAFALFAGSAVTDFFDGWLARRMERESRLGRLLDPVADKLLVVLVLVALVAVGDIAGWHLIAVFAIVGREFLISGFREFLAGTAIELPVSMLAKYKTTVQLAALALLIAAPATAAPVPQIALAGLWIAAALTLATGYDYMTATLRHIRARAPAGGE